MSRWMMMFLVLAPVALAGCAGDTADTNDVGSDVLADKGAGADDEVRCVLQCGGRECGSDGCGGSCGVCYTLEGAADDSLWMPQGYCCEAGCLGLECGDNGCGGSWGECAEG